MDDGLTLEDFSDEEAPQINEWRNATQKRQPAVSRIPRVTFEQTDDHPSPGTASSQQGKKLHTSGLIRSYGDSSPTESDIASDNYSDQDGHVDVSDDEEDEEEEDSDDQEYVPPPRTLPKRIPTRMGAQVPAVDGSLNESSVSANASSASATQSGGSSFNSSPLVVPAIKIPTAGLSSARFSVRDLLVGNERTEEHQRGSGIAHRQVIGAEDSPRSAYSSDQQSSPAHSNMCVHSYFIGIDIVVSVRFNITS